MNETGAGIMELPAELLEFKAVVRRFIDEQVIPHEKDGEMSPEVLARVLAQMKDLGIWAANVPAEFGGAGLGALGYLMVSEEICRTTLWLPLYSAGNAMLVLTLGTEEQKQRYLYPSVTGDRLGCFALTEPQGGSDPGGTMRTEAHFDGTNWTLNGRKTFITFGNTADYALVFAVTDRTKRQHGGITLFLVDKGTEGFSVVRSIQTMGEHRPVELDFHDVVVSDAQRLGEVGEGFVMAQRVLGGARAFIGAYAVGVCSRLLDMAVDYTQEREAFGKPLSEHGQVQAVLADCAIELEACRWLTYRAGAEAERGGDTRILDSIVKVYASELVSRVSDKILQIHGGWGYSKDLPIERFYRDSRFFRIAEGPNEVHRMLISRELVKGRRP
ncbi:MAG: acyl-CoA dehydrogenase family protein [Acidimicrobiales bacterium]